MPEYSSDKQRRWFHTATAARKGITAAEVDKRDTLSKGKKLPMYIKKARGGDIPEPEGEEMEPENMLDRTEHTCPECGSHFAFGGEALKQGYAKGGELPEPRGEEMEPPDMVFCPGCGHRFAGGGEIPEPEGEEMEPANQPGNFMGAMRTLRPGKW